jgi:SMC interacting uncharacterized protein involved in chromosome segregation
MKFLEFVHVQAKDLLEEIGRQKKLTPDIKKSLEETVANYQSLT